MVILVSFLVCVVCIALAIALAPYILGLLGVALLVVLALATIGLVLVALGAGERRFAKWFDNTRNRAGSRSLYGVYFTESPPPPPLVTGRSRFSELM